MSACHRERTLYATDSIARLIAGCARFLTFTQCFDRHQSLRVGVNYRWGGPAMGSLPCSALAANGVAWRQKNENEVRGVKPQTSLDQNLTRKGAKYRSSV